jgi:tRNA threonylcarbamoyladenosine biosynthesis protein TsaB
MAGVAPAGSDETGGDAIGESASITFGIMTILAIDTTSRAGSLAVLRAGVVLYDAEGDPAVTHGQRLPTDVMRALAAVGLRIDEVELFAVAAGPGSFTGLRVGIATVQGLAMAHGRRVVAVSVLEALARAGAATAQATGAWMDAQRGQVFAALYGPGGTVLAGPTALTPEETLDAWRGLAPLGEVQFIGDGARRYADVLARAGARHVAGPPPLARIVGQIAAAEPDRAVLPHAIVPVYVRRSDAELARERRTGP